jgi:transcriptional regulator with XRE-family HTH domain
MEKQDAFYAEVGRLVREERKAKKLTQDELAEKVHLNRVSITNIESGKQKILLHTLVDIANALEVSPDKFLPKAEGKINYETVKTQLDTREAKKIGKIFFEQPESKKV